jgi:Fe-S-cluster containining protein
MRETFRDHPARGGLLELYREVDRAYGGVSCEQSTECCRFGITGREPYVTPLESSLLRQAIQARGGLPRRRALPIAGESPCPLLTDEGRCSVYEARPFGCRTFYCERASGREPTRAEVRELSQRLTHLAEAFAVSLGQADPGPRPLRRVFAAAAKRR